MRKLLISTLVTIAWVVPALAQGAPKNASVPPKAAQDQTTPPKAAQDQDESLKQGVQAIERNVQTSLAQAGFTDVQMIPTSFLVRAKDPDGNPIMLTLGPDSVGQSTEEAPGSGQDNRSCNDIPIMLPLAASPISAGAR